MRLCQSNKNISNEIQKIVANQAANKNNKPEYLKQFDELTFSSDINGSYNDINGSYSDINGSYNDINGSYNDINGSYNDINGSYNDINGSYSDINDINNSCKQSNNFIHNNMIPFTSKRDTHNSNKSQRKLETFTGIFDNYTSKTEKLHLFDPMKDLTFVHGMPSTYVTSLQDRLYTSNKNQNGDLPFQHKVKVKPGINNLNQTGRNSVYRITPSNIDHLRTDINKKITYENKPLETIKKGEVRGINANITKFKIPDFREQKFSDLVPNKYVVEANKLTGEYTNISSQRNEEDNYIPGPPIYLTMGTITQPLYEESKKINLFNDCTHSTYAINNKPVVTNAKSFTNYDTHRATTNSNYESNINNVNNTNNYILSNDMIIPTTNRDTTNDIDILGPSTYIKSIYSNLTDMAKETMRNMPNIITNSSNIVKSVYTNLTDTTRETMRNMPNIITNGNNIEKSVYTNLMDEARETMRNMPNIITNGNNIEKSVYTNLMDEARETMRNMPNIITNGNNLEKSVYTNLTDTTRETMRNMPNIITNGNNIEKSVYTNLTDLAKETMRNMPNIITNSNNLEKSVYTNLTDLAKETMRNMPNIITNSNNLEKSVYTNLTDLAKETMRNMPNIITNGNNLEKSVYSNLTDTTRETIKQTTEKTYQIGHANRNDKLNYSIDYNDIAKNTIKQTTEETKYIGSVIRNDKLNYCIDYNDIAKNTIRQTTETTKHIGQAIANDKLNYTIDYTDIAKPTIKETTENTMQIGQAVANDKLTYTIDYTDNAKPTIKQTTIINDNIIGIRKEILDASSHLATDNMTIDDRREISTYNQTSNGVKDLYGPYINKKTVKLIDPILYSYSGPPIKRLDNNIMINDSESNYIYDVFHDKKTINNNEAFNYNINYNYISALDNNPLVNDIFHRKYL